LIAKCGMITSLIEDVLQSPSPSGASSETQQVIAIGHAGADVLLRTAYCPDKFPHRVLLLNKEMQILEGSCPSSSYTSTAVQRGSGIVTIAGPLCFSGDIVASSLDNFPVPVAGDICVILDAGANTISLFSRHCSRVFPVVFAFRQGKLCVIRQAETDEEVLEFWD